MDQETDQQPQFVTVLRELIHHPQGGCGEIDRLAELTGVARETLVRWDSGDFPKQRLTGAVKDVDAWARRTVPDYAPQGIGLVQLSGKRRLTGKPPRRGPQPAQVELGRGGDRPVQPSGTRDHAGSRRSVVLGLAVGLLLALGGAALALGRDDEPRRGGVVELSGNRLGVVVFGDREGRSVPRGVPARIPYGTQVTVDCVADDQTGIASVTALYLIADGTWEGLYAVSDSFTNGDVLGATEGATVDPRIRPCD